MAPTRPPVRTYSRRQSFKDSPVSLSAKPSGDSNALTRTAGDELDELPRKRRNIAVTPSKGDRKKKSAAAVPRSSPRRALSAKEADDDTLTPSPSRRSTEKAIRPNGNGKEKTPDHHSLWHASIERETTLGEHVSASRARETDASLAASGSGSSFSTPKKNPKDLSHLFEALSPQRRNPSGSSHGISTSNSPGKMLSRSKTESSLEDSPSKSPQALSKTQSLVEPLRRIQPPVTRNTSPSPIRNNRFIAYEDEGSPSASGSQSQSQSQGREAMTSYRTYAGRTRSFLVALPTSSLAARTLMNDMKEEPRDEEEDYSRVSYAELRQRYGVDNSEGPTLGDDADNKVDDGEGLALYNNLSSITDLRSKGESRRFLDEIGYLFEGLDPSGSLSVRRGSAFDIINKLCDEEYWRRARAAGFLVEIWDQLRAAGAGDGDRILDSVLCCFVSLASNDPRDISLLTSREDFVATLVQLLTSHLDNDPFAAGEHISKQLQSKSERLLMKRLREAISQNSAILQEGCSPSARVLASNAFAAIPSFAFPDIKMVLDSVAGDLSRVSTRLNAYRTGLPLFPSVDESTGSHEKLCLYHIHNALAILDLYLIETSIREVENLPSKADLWQPYNALASQLMSLITLSDAIEHGDFCEALGAQASRCSDLAFRVLINFTNGSSPWSDSIIAEPHTLPTLMRLVSTFYLSVRGANKKAEEEDTSSMDRLCLALALLTNLVQENEDLAEMLQDYKSSPHCKRARACLLGCQCHDTVSSTSALISMYISLLQSEDDELSTDLHFLRGHLAVFLGLIILRLQDSSSACSPLSPPVQSLLDKLPGAPGGIKEKLDALIANIHVFSSLYATLSGGVRRTLPSDRDQDESDLYPPSAPPGTGSDNIALDVVTSVAESLRALRQKL